MIRISVDDTVLRYVRADHRWWVLAGGIVIVVLAAVAALRDHLPTLLGRKRPPEHHHDEHEHRERLSPWLMVVPALVLAVAAPAALGANTLTRTALPTAPPIEVRYDPLPPGDAPELTFMEFVSRAGSDDGATLTGRTVTLVGFTAPGPASPASPSPAAPRTPAPRPSASSATRSPAPTRTPGFGSPAPSTPEAPTRTRTGSPPCTSAPCRSCPCPRTPTSTDLPVRPGSRGSAESGRPARVPGGGSTPGPPGLGRAHPPRRDRDRDLLSAREEAESRPSETGRRAARLRW